MRLRSVLEELEAHLVAPSGARTPSGKAERKRYGNGDERLKLRASGLTAPDGTRVDVRIDADVVACPTVAGGRVSVALESPGVHVPAVRSGQRLELAIAGTVVLAGEFRPE